MSYHNICFGAKEKELSQIIFSIIALSGIMNTLKR